MKCKGKLKTKDCNTCMVQSEGVQLLSNILCSGDPDKALTDKVQETTVYNQEQHVNHLIQTCLPSAEFGTQIVPNHLVPDKLVCG